MPDQENDPEVTPPARGTPQAKGVRSLTSDTFSISDSIGGVRGAIETMAPGFVFVVAFVVTRELMPPLVLSMVVAVLAVVVRLVQRTPVTQAFSGLFGVGIGVFWAWKSGDATQYFAYGLWTNGAYLLGLLLSIAFAWPAVGVVVELLKSGIGLVERETHAHDAETSAGPGAPADGAGRVEEYPAETHPAETVVVDGIVVSTGFPVPDTTVGTTPPDADARDERTAQPIWSTSWRKDRALMKRYMIATWLWVGLFAVRLAVQLPLYLNSEVGWLGTARLVMGIPLWGLVLWATWVLVRQPASPAAAPTTTPDR